MTPPNKRHSLNGTLRPSWKNPTMQSILLPELIKKNQQNTMN